MRNILKSSITVSALSALIFMISCGPSLQVGQDYDSSVNLRQFKSYTVEPEKAIEQDPLLGSELNRRRLNDAVSVAMAKKGYKQTEDRPELVVKFMTDVKDRQQIRSNNNFSPYYWWYGPMGNNNYSTYNYQESRFIINIYQADTGRMIWQGWASGKMKAPNKQQDQDKILKNTIEEIMRSFPQATSDTYSRN